MEEVEEMQEVEDVEEVEEVEDVEVEEEGAASAVPQIPGSAQSCSVVLAPTPPMIMFLRCPRMLEPSACT